MARALASYFDTGRYWSAWVPSRLSRWAGLESAYPIVIHGQELTTSRFHIAAVGVATMVAPRLPAREAIAAIHRQGGVAIASHRRVMARPRIGLAGNRRAGRHAARPSRSYLPDAAISEL